jgi:predicted nucleotidyltransferase
MKEKRLPPFVRPGMLYRFFQSKPGRITSNWILQGMLYMNPIEVTYKLMLDMIFTVGWAGIGLGASTTFGWGVAWVMAHTTNWVLNGQPVAMLRHLDWGRNDAGRFLRYVDLLEERIQGKPYLRAVASFGSLSRGRYTVRSDLDIRMVMQDGMINHLRAAHFCFAERIRALFSRFPLDLYAFTIDELKEKMSSDEVPIVYADPQGVLDCAYQSTVPYSVFRERLRGIILSEGEK